MEKPIHLTLHEMANLMGVAPEVVEDSLDNLEKMDIIRWDEDEEMFFLNMELAMSAMNPLVFMRMYDDMKEEDA
jgi:hypothetical protein